MITVPWLSTIPRWLMLGFIGEKEREGYCSEEELGSSTSCSVDSFEITSPFNTLSLNRDRRKREQTEEETPKIEAKEESPFSDFQSGCKFTEK